MESTLVEGQRKDGDAATPTDIICRITFHPPAYGSGTRHGFQELMPYPLPGLVPKDSYYQNSFFDKMSYGTICSTEKFHSLRCLLQRNIPWDLSAGISAKT